MLLNVAQATITSNLPPKLLTSCQMRAGVRRMHFQEHQEAILSLVQDWLVGGRNTDVTVAVIEDKTIYSIKCHRLILASASGFLASILAESLTSHQDDDISILLSDISNHHLELLISYLYTGMASFDSRQARSSFLELLTALNVDVPPLMSDENPTLEEDLKADDMLAEAVDMLNASSTQDLVEMVQSEPVNPPPIIAVPPTGPCPQNNSSLAPHTQSGATSHPSWVLPKDFFHQHSDHVHEGLKGPHCHQGARNEEPSSATHCSSMRDLELSTVDQTAILYAFPLMLPGLGRHERQDGLESLPANEKNDADFLPMDQSFPLSSSSMSSASSKENNDADLHFITDEIQTKRLKNGSVTELNPLSLPLLPLSEKEPPDSNPRAHGMEFPPVRDEDHHHPGSSERGKRKQKFQCQQCDKFFPSKHYLGFHESSVHFRIKSHQCQECDKVFTGDYYLRQHVRRMHSDSRPFACKNCPSSFSVRYDLVVHMRTHEVVKQFKCDYCSKTYATHRALKEHSRTHTGEKPFECKECGKTFALPKTLRVHYRQHSGERPYLCSHCGMTFVQNSTLRNHLRHHQKSKAPSVSVLSQPRNEKPSET